MASSKLFGRGGQLVLGRGTTNGKLSTTPFHQQSQSIHEGPSPSPYQLKRYYNNALHQYNKCKDSILLFEATKGPLGKMGVGIVQSVTTAGLVFGGGYALTLFTRDHDHSYSPQLTDVQNEYDEKLWGRRDAFEYFQERESRAERRINLTYFHLASSLIAAGTMSLLSFRLFKNKALLVKIGDRPLVAVGVGVVTPFLMASIVRGLPRTADDGRLIPFGFKEFGHLLYAGTLGLVAAPLYLLGGQSMIRAGYVTAGCMAGLHGVAKAAPKNAFINWEGPLIIGMNAVLISFLMTLFLRRGHYAFMPLYRFMMHGGLLIYSLHYVHSLQKMQATSRSSLYDPVNASMTLSVNLLNIFGRLAFMLPPYWQLSREHILTVAGKNKGELVPSTSTHPMNTGKPGGGGGGGGGGGEGNGN